MKVLLVSSSISNRQLDYLYAEKQIPMGFAIQKYYKLMEGGLIDNGVNVDVLSNLPIPSLYAPFKYKKIKSETVDGVSYHYVPYIKRTAIYHTFLLLYVFFYVFFWGIKNRKDGVVLCDVLIPCRCIGTIWGAWLAGVRRIGWVTDMPGMVGENHKKYEEMGLLGKLHMKSIAYFSGFVYISELSDAILNPKKKPYIVMEGLVDPMMGEKSPIQKNNTRDILYAGGLVEMYGLDYLCQAFMKLPYDDIRLVIYGHGPFSVKLEEYAKIDSRIDFRGQAKNDEIVHAEQAAMLLVNPRFTGADYTLYSFPSKNIEYMVSGTPMVTTRLEAIPEDYYSYMYSFDEETIDGYYDTLNELLKKDKSELECLGAEAQQYILKYKNANVQARRVIDLANIL